MAGGEEIRSRDLIVESQRVKKKVKWESEGPAVFDVGKMGAA